MSNKDVRGTLSSSDEENGPLYFGEWIKRRRTELDLTQEQLAKRANCSVFAIRKIESGERKPSRLLAGLFAEALDIPGESRDAFIKAARGELSVDRLLSPARAASIDPQSTVKSRAIPGYLPGELTPFIGREPELAALGELLEDAHCRLLTIVGPGGIGKTRLATELAKHYKDHFPDGVWFVPLAALNSPALIVPSIAAAVNCKFPDPSNPQAQLLHFLQEKRALIFLDNAEHLLDCVDLIIEILNACPYVKLLVTSRERLNLLSEWVFEITGLPVPSSEQVEQFESYSSVALFLQSARRAQAGFTLREEDRRDVLKICQIAEGLPLAIVLSATWVRMLSAAEIAAEIEQSLDFLNTSAQDISERHRSIQAVFNHSWKMLSTLEQQALCRLSVFRGGFTRAAAAQVTGMRLDTLSALVAKSLVQYDGEKRFSLHELIRQYAARRLETSEECEVARRQHIAFFTNFAEEGRDHFGEPSMPNWLKSLDQDNDNLRAALEYSIRLQASHMALRLCVELWRFWECRGYIDEGRHWLKSSLDLPVSLTEEYRLDRGKALTAAGSLARIQGDFTEAHRLYEESLALRRSNGDVKGIAAGLNSLGILAMFESKYTEAANYLEESLQLFRKLDIKKEIVRPLNNLGVVAMYQGDYDRARLLHQECLGIYQELNDRHGVAGSLGNLGDVMRYQGEYHRAKEVLEESLALFQEIGDVHGIVITAASTARVHLAKGEADQALAAFHSSLLQNKPVGDKTEMANSFEGIAEALGVDARNSTLPEERIQLGVRLLAAADRLRSTVGALRSPVEQADVDQITAQLRSLLPEDDFRMEWKRGVEMTTEQAVEFALFHLSEIVDTAGGARGPVSSETLN